MANSIISIGGAVPEKKFNAPLAIYDTQLGGKNYDAETGFNLIQAASRIDNGRAIKATGASGYDSAYDVPMLWADGSKLSVNALLKKKGAGIFASGNTLIPDWANLWNATRMDLTQRVQALPTVRQEFYQEVFNAAYTRSITLGQFMPTSVIFEKNNGEGQSVRQGETLGGQTDTVIMDIYAAGFTWTLLAELFAQGYMGDSMLMDGVARGYSALKDDLALSPILTASITGDAATGAHVLSGAGRQELLYLTLEDAIDDLGDRDDPARTGRKIDASSGLKILAHPWDAPHIANVLKGLPSSNEKYYPGISQISQVVAYNGDVIPTRTGSVTYSGCVKGTAYLIAPNPYMVIPIKRGLTMEADMTPDVTKLSREQRSWYFVESIYTYGIAYYIQKITLPTW